MCIIQYGDLRNERCIYNFIYINIAKVSINTTPHSSNLVCCTQDVTGYDEIITDVSILIILIVAEFQIENKIIYRFIAPSRKGISVSRVDVIVGYYY